jgi:ring-1,2-phenylacetyl-CoA epoxidase subunit PaaE
MTQFHTLKVKSITKETADAVSISFDIPEEIKSEFTYKSGQFITFKVTINGEVLNRSYSLCSSDALNEDVTIGVKIVKGGKVSTYLNNTIKVGDTIEAMLPTGNFFVEPNANSQKHYILFAGGSGITPMFSIIKTVLNKEPKSKISLIYANFHGDSVIFKNQLTELAQNNPEKLTIQHVFDEPRKKRGVLGFGKKSLEDIPYIDGRVHKELAKQLIEQATKSNFSNTEFYMCGPVGLMDSVGAALKALDIPKEQINREYFTEKSKKSKQAADVGTGSESFSGTSKVTITNNGKNYELDISENQNVLDAAIDAGVEPPFACMVGDCSSCKAKIIEGAVHMDDALALTPKEIAAGFILTCQSHPKSDVLKINYDV